MTTEAVLVEVYPVKKRTYWYVFEPSEDFEKPWWGRQGSVEDGAHWLSLHRRGIEVARCKFMLYEGPLNRPGLGNMPHGQLDILTLEVAVRQRGRGIGREMLRLIREAYPSVRLTALNDDDQSRGFWDRMGWIRHEHPNPFLRDAARVTYSEG